jgi:hypothetical protein
MKSDSQKTHQSFWLWVMCLTGVDYFSTLGYQPSMAFEATGLLAPLATLILVAVTLGCALPIYCYVAAESPAGQGSISMLERLLHGWKGKFLVLVLLGFAATDYVITKTMSSADAAEHLVHNPLWQALPEPFQSQTLLTMSMLVLLGAVFLRGFREAIGLAVALTAVYLTLNVIVIGSALVYLVRHQELIQAWYDNVQQGNWHMEHPPVEGTGWLSILAICLLFFPKLALGLSGFETGVAVMPLVKGDPDDDPDRPRGRIRNTRKLLTAAAIIMSLLLIGSALTTATLIDPLKLEKGGEAANRALAFIAHGEAGYLINPIFGEVFGTLYDLSTVSILWFAGASAMSGLINLVPRYLPRYGMAPEWASAIRPLVVLFTVVALIVTWFFDASVEAQGGAYATGVMVLISSASVAVVIDKFNKRKGAMITRIPWGMVFISMAFLYTTGAIMIEKPEGMAIASFFITGVVGVSLLSRTMRSTELRLTRFEFVDDHSRFLWDTLKHLEFPVLVPHRTGRRSIVEKEDEIRSIHRLTPDIPIVFVEATLGDTSEFYHTPKLEIAEEEGRFIIRVQKCVSIAHVLAAIALELSKVGQPPELHFGWSEESPLAANLRFVLFGEGNVPWLVRELIRLAEPDPAKRPRVVIG